MFMIKSTLVKMMINDYQNIKLILKNSVKKLQKLYFRNGKIDLDVDHVLPHRLGSSTTPFRIQILIHQGYLIHQDYVTPI